MQMRSSKKALRPVLKYLFVMKRT